jgi:Holliday junction resolvase
MKHFLVKSAVAKYLFGKGYYVFTERNYNGHVCDIFAFKKEEMLIVEIETKKINKKIASFESDYGIPHVTLFVENFDLNKIEEQLKPII